jgi:hypothetical protein
MFVETKVVIHQRTENTMSREYMGKTLPVDIDNGYQNIYNLISTKFLISKNVKVVARSLINLYN